MEKLSDKLDAVWQRTAEELKQEARGGLVTVRVQTTGYTQSHAKVKPDLAYKIFKPYIMGLGEWLFIGFILAIGVLMLTKGAKRSLIVIPIVLLIIFYARFRNRKDRFVWLRVDRSGISGEGVSYSWHQIDETALMHCSVVDEHASVYYHYLILTLKEGGVQLLDIKPLFGFKRFSGVLARYIEFFKATPSAVSAG